MPDTRRINGPEISLCPYNFCQDQLAEPILQADGSRADGRKEKEHRPIYLRTGLISQARGSAYAEFSRTKVICAIYGPREVARREDFQMKGQVVCDFKFAPFSCRVRHPHLQDNQEKDLSTQLLEALEPAICLDRFPKSEVDVYVTVLENDGGALSAAITCASLALADAGIEMYDLVVGCSAKILGQKIWIDPTEREESYKGSENDGKGLMTLGLMPSLYQVSALTFLGDIDSEVLSQGMQICQDTCQKLYPVLQQALVKTVTERLKNS